MPTKKFSGTLDICSEKTYISIVNFLGISTTSLALSKFVKRYWLASERDIPEFFLNRKIIKKMIESGLI